jgi:geranylgeranyl pyrophosphate synthase
VTLARVAEGARRSASGSLAAAILVEGAAPEEREKPSIAAAARAVEALEAGLRLHDEILDLGPGEDGGDPGIVASGLGGAWLLGSGAESIAELGDVAAAMWGDAAHRIVRARMIEFGDLYDAGRTPARYLSTAELGSGSLLSLAARLGALASGADQRTLAALDEFGRELGVAAQIRADLAALDDPDRPAALRVGAGRYGLPVLLAIEADPGIAGLLGKPLGGEGLATALERVRSAGGAERAGEELRRRVSGARSALDAVSGTESLAEIASGVEADLAEAAE